MKARHVVLMRPLAGFSDGSTVVREPKMRPAPSCRGAGTARAGAAVHEQQNREPSTKFGAWRAHPSPAWITLDGLKEESGEHGHQARRHLRGLRSGYRSVGVDDQGLAGYHRRRPHGAWTQVGGWTASRTRLCASPYGQPPWSVRTPRHRRYDGGKIILGLESRDAPPKVAACLRSSPPISITAHSSSS